MPDAPGLELILAEINRSHPGAVLDTSFDREQACLIVNPAAILDVLTWLHDTPGQEYTFLSSVHGVDYYPHAPRFGVHYELLNRPRYERLRVKAVLPDPAVEPEAAAMDSGAPAAPETSVVAPAAAGGIDPEVPEKHAAGSDASKRSVAASTTNGAAVGETPSLPVGDDRERSGTPDDSEAVEGKAGERASTAGESGVGPEGFQAPGGTTPDSAAPTTTVRNGEVLPMLSSCVELFPTADFQEREVFDFFGVVFEGHPDLRRILMPEDYVGWPQRRDFPVGGEPVLFTKDEVTSPGWWK